jgi:uncharacterized protein (UPF0332 family)
MKARDFLDVADQLIGEITEAHWRTAVGRAYYAAFHAARDLLRSCGFDVPRGEQAHAYLWLRLSNSGHPDVANAGMELNDLRRLRNWSDYDLDQPLNHVTAAAQLRSADSVLQVLELIPTMPTLQLQITDAMKIYERDVLQQVTWRP